MAMQIANALVALGGDDGNKVPKYGVTAAEIAVLQAIHGADSVSEIEPAGEIARRSSDELARLRETYGMAKDEDNKPIINRVFPGSAPRLPQSLDELELADVFFKAVERVTSTTAVSASAAALAEANAEQTASLDDDDFFDDITTQEPEPAAAKPASRRGAKNAGAFA